MGGVASRWTPGTTPFRYPGGKAFLCSDIQRLLREIETNRPMSYAEPYAGGGGAAIRLLASGTVERIILNDFDWRIYAAWHSMLYDADKFVDQLQSISLDVATWYQQRDVVLNADPATSDIFDVGFATFFLNRTNRSGIIVGAGPIGGYNQKGKWKIDARFSREALGARIKWLSEHREQIELCNDDGLSFLKEKAKEAGQKTFFFIDPPYVNAGSRLYMNAMSELLHLNLAKFLIGNVDMPHWLVTYDDHPLIRSAYASANIETLDVRYTLQNKRSAGELVIMPLAN